MTSRSKGLGKISANDKLLSDLRPLTIMQSVRAGWKAVTLFARTSAPIHTNTPNKCQHTQAFMAKKQDTGLLNTSEPSYTNASLSHVWTVLIDFHTSTLSVIRPTFFLPVVKRPLLSFISSSLPSGSDSRERRRGELRDEERRSGGEQESAWDCKSATKASHRFRMEN